MSIAATSIKRRTFVWFATLVVLVAGMISFTSLGRLEDPQFTIKTAAVVTLYPGASIEETELEVTDLLETAIQELPQVKEVESFSRAGLSVVKVYIKASYRSPQLPQVWDELRRKVSDAHQELPPGVMAPQVNDDFGDVYGFFLSVVADGFTSAELERYTDDLKKELSVVPGVARVELWGVQPQCVYVNISEARAANLGIRPAEVQRTLAQQNMVVQAGSLEVQDLRLRIDVTGTFTTTDDIGELTIRGGSLPGTKASQELIRIRDVATVERGYIDPPVAIMRHNGLPAIGLALSNAPGVNIVDLGLAIDARLSELMADLPVGIEVERIAWQGDQVKRSIDAFMVGLAQAVLIVLVVLVFAMGLRSAFIVGMAGLVFVIFASFLVMKIFGIDLHRMSLGALIVAMGMMVDNAIVVCDGVLVRFQSGMDRVKAAIEAATQPSTALLGATIIAVMAFYPIFASDEGAGEYCATLFSVVAVSLLISWVFSVTITPVMCLAMLPSPKAGAVAVDPYSGRFYGVFRGVLRNAIRFRYGVVLVCVGLLAASLIGFRWVDKMFFPASDRAQFMVDYWAPEGTRIQQVSADLRELEEYLLGQEAATSVSTFVGQGPVRFYLPVDPESPYASYGQLIVNTTDAAGAADLIPKMQAWADENVASSNVVVRKYGLGPGETWPVQIRVSGPAIADAEELRRWGERVADLVDQSSEALVVRTDWRQRTQKLMVEYDQRNGRWAGISRLDLANATSRAYDGLVVGQYREQDKLLPIVLRNTESNRQRAAANIEALQVRAPLGGDTVPLSQVTRRVEVEWDESLIWRYNRRRAICVQAVPVGLAATLRDDVAAGVEALRDELPPGYEIMWDGEYRNSRDSQASLVPGTVPAFIVISLVIVGLFNAFRPALIIACMVPFAMIGVTAGLLITRQPFGFVAMLGAMSLAGMMVKNAIVLLDQVKIEKEAGRSDYDAIVESAVSRLRPVMLAAGTTVLGVIPLLPDVFWVSLAVTIMFGLTLGSVLTMIVLPVLYSIFYNIKVPDQNGRRNETSKIETSP